MPSPSNKAERVVRSLDELQQRHSWLAHPVGVIRKYADDRGSALAGLMTFQVFLGMLPLLVVALTVFGRILEADEEVAEGVLQSTVVQFPVIGDRLEDSVSALSVEGLWIWVTILGLLWTAAGIYHSFQLALNQVWNVPGVHRQGFVSRHARALVLFVLVFAAALGGSLLRESDLVLSGSSGWVMQGLSFIGGALVASVLLLAVFRFVVAPVVETRCLVPAALLAGVSWEVLQRIGSWIVMDRLAQAEDLYGAIGFVLVALFWINLLARSAVLANEFAVVTQRNLWPRRITQPPLSSADREVLAGLIANETRRPEEQVSLVFRSDVSERDSDDDQVDTVVE
jgi:membrane protein